MNSAQDTSKVLGAVFLIQATTSLISGVILLKLLAPGNINDILLNIANHVWLMRANIFGEMTTAVGVIFLGAMLFVVLRKQNEKMALAALGFYILEAALLAVSRIGAFSLISISQEYVIRGHLNDLQSMGTVALASMDYGYKLLMFPFCLGAILFYYLFYESRMIPRGLSLWGLIAVGIILIATLFSIAGYDVPFFVYIPYVPFEFVVGAWILAKGLDHYAPGKGAAA
jgi:Domain of unknown function (DUF4386)